MDFRTAACNFYQLNRTPVEELPNLQANDRGRLVPPETGDWIVVDGTTSQVQLHIRSTATILGMLPLIIRGMGESLNTAPTCLAERCKFYRLFIDLKDSEEKRRVGVKDGFQTAINWVNDLEETPYTTPTLESLRVDEAAALLNVPHKPSLVVRLYYLGVDQLLPFLQASDREALTALGVPIATWQARLDYRIRRASLSKTEVPWQLPEPSKWQSKILSTTKSPWAQRRCHAFCECADGVLVTSSDRGELHFWSGDKPVGCRKVSGRVSQIVPVADGRFATAHTLTHWTVWSRDTNDHFQLQAPEHSFPQALALLSNRGWVSLATNYYTNQSVLQVHAPDGGLVAVCKTGAKEIKAVLALPENKFAAIIEGRLTIWSQQPGSNPTIWCEEHRLEANEVDNPGRAMARAADGRLVLATRQGNLYFWDVDSDVISCDPTFLTDRPGLSQLLTLPSGAIVACCSDRICIWEGFCTPPTELPLKGKYSQSRCVAIRCTPENTIHVTYADGVCVSWKAKAK